MAAEATGGMCRMRNLIATVLQVKSPASSGRMSARGLVPHLRPSQVQGLDLWVGATEMARSGCQNAVLGALQTWGFRGHATRPYLRGWLYDGSARAAPCQVPLEVAACFAPLLRWVWDEWEGTALTLAIDPTTKEEALVALIIRVVYRGSALPVAWHLKPGGQARALDPRPLWPAGPPRGRGVGHPDGACPLRPGPRLWEAICRQGWHPYMRYDRHMTFPAATGPRRPAWRFVAEEGPYTVTARQAFRQRPRRCTLSLLWAPGPAAPWVVLTDEAPTVVDLGAYGMRVWMAQGFPGPQA